MEIKNLAQLKRAIQDGKCFTIVEHIRPECIGEYRKPTCTQTNGFYSAKFEDVVMNRPLSNSGKGLWVEYGKASHWEFADGICRQHMEYKMSGELVRRPLWAIKFD